MLFDVNHPQRRYDVRTAGVLISPHSLASGDNGTVIVAASFVHSDHNIRLAIYITVIIIVVVVVVVVEVMVVVVITTIIIILIYFIKC